MNESFPGACLGSSRSAAASSPQPAIQRRDPLATVFNKRAVSLPAWLSTSSTRNLRPCVYREQERALAWLIYASPLNCQAVGSLGHPKEMSPGSCLCARGNEKQGNSGGAEEK